MEPYLVNLIIYQTLLIPIIFLSVLYYFLGFTTLFVKIPRYKFPKVSNEDLPTVSIQIPVYNDPVAIRCIRKCLKFNYPKNKYEILVADDSTDEVTKKIIDRFAANKKQVKVFRRGARDGYKPGALNYILPHTKGDVIVIFDADFTPKKGFLRKLVTPFVVENDLTVVQSRMEFINYDYNTISRFASALLMIFHNCFMPINNRLNTVFFCGTGGAIKKEVLLKVGGWNQKSITEDSDLSVILLEKGYKNIYVHNLTVAGEVPFTLKSFLRQQQRWAYGITRIFVERWRTILFSPNFRISQKAMITFLTTAYVMTPIIIFAAISGQLGWIITPPKPLQWADAIKFGLVFFYTSGFMFLGSIGVHRSGKIRDFFKLFFAAYVIGVILSFTNMIAFFKAVFGIKSGWIRTPKMGSRSILEFFRRVFGRPTVRDE